MLGTDVVSAADHDIFNVPDRVTLNFYGSPGLIDMPVAAQLPDGQFGLGVSYFGGNSRMTLTFQATPRLSASFRYSGIDVGEANKIGGYAVYRDRSFDVRYLLKKESKFWPAVTVGLQDFAGTGIYAGEYIVATKVFEHPRVAGKVNVTAGLGWGRLGSSGAIGAPFGGGRSSFDVSSTGGKPSYDQWFRGPAAPFGGVEWHIDDKWAIKAEYSSDAYTQEAVQRDVFTKKSRFNFGAEYQYSERMRIGAYYLYGSEIGVNFQLQFNPKKPMTPIRIAPTAPIKQRPNRALQPQAYATDWITNESAPRALRDQLKPVLEQNGLTIEALQVTSSSAEMRFRNERYQARSLAIGRAARAMAEVLPASIETFRIVLMENNLAQSAVTIRRSDLEALEFDPLAADALLTVTGIGEASPRLANAVYNNDLYPDFSWSLGPYLAPSYFDPDQPVRVDAGVELVLNYKPSPGWSLGANLKYRLAGNVGDSSRSGGSKIEPVRTNGVLYSQGSDLSVETAYISKQWKPGNDLYARITAGYLERMFGGVSGELLWKPVASRLALGVETNYVKQRAFSGLGFQDYSVATGHASAYYEFGRGYHGQLDVGRYLAGDYGATATLTREFDNGWRVGGFFTVTDVSASDFGEGSFDKGINFTVPVSWFIGTPGKRTVSTTVRPIQRDGGARLAVPGRLYEQVRSGHKNAVVGQWSRVWE
ncbi:Exopolysaccharide biosynthesis protein YbjH [Sulfitobacter brevis]|uniref:Exopolysaccharide biosynthesis protein YbjH n=2 Tax=Sulfitobacter brevis TaxID=74348 RepID=A0A1I1YIX4_9RHOB|nr:Exopolysaccharide biosynthesis protein YbjH [Sulfitobacter brevis]